MFVIVKLATESFDNTIISVHNTLNEAIEAFHNAVSKYKKDKDNYDILIMNETRIEIIERNAGWFTSGKVLKSVFQIIKYKGKYSTDYIINTDDANNSNNWDGWDTKCTTEEEELVE